MGIVGVSFFVIKVGGRIEVDGALLGDDREGELFVLNSPSLANTSSPLSANLRFALLLCVIFAGGDLTKGDESDISTSIRRSVGV